MGDRVQRVAKNRKARHDYEILDRFEAGIALLGSEVKSLRDGRANIAEAYVRIEDGEAWLVDAHIAPYRNSTIENHEPLRRRKLLLKRRQLARLARSVQQRGLTLVPISLYFRGPWAKVEVALARGRRSHDKRQALKRKQDRRDMRES